MIHGSALETSELLGENYCDFFLDIEIKHHTHHTYSEQRSEFGPLRALNAKPRWILGSSDANGTPVLTDEDFRVLQ